LSWLLLYLTPLFRLGATMVLEPAVIIPPSKCDRAGPCHDRVHALWNAEVACVGKINKRERAIHHARADNMPPNAMGRQWKKVGGRVYVPWVPRLAKVLWNAFRYWRVWYAIALTLVFTLLFSKALTVSALGRVQTSTGQVVNMMSNDTQQLQCFLKFFGLTLVAPTQIIISLILIYRQVGVPTWVGIAFMVLLVPVNGVIFWKVSMMRRRMLKHSNARVKMNNEIVMGISTIKFYAWEGPFGKEVNRIREKEPKALMTLAYTTTIGFSLIMLSSPIIIPMLVFLAYIHMSAEGLDAVTAFTTTALFNIRRFPFTFLPMGLLQLIEKGTAHTVEGAVEAAKHIGYENGIMNKVSEGGRGKGIRFVDNKADLRNSDIQVSNEVLGSPNFIIQLCKNAHHIEVQIVGDQHGNAIALKGCDGSTQRRFQKIFEKGPPVIVPTETVHEMELAAQRLTQNIGYQGAGTVEYLYNAETNKYFFLELKPSLQVEHPVTEGITGTNLPAAGSPCSWYYTLSWDYHIEWGTSQGWDLISQTSGRLGTQSPTPLPPDPGVFTRGLVASPILGPTRSPRLCGDVAPLRLLSPKAGKERQKLCLLKRLILLVK
jgi:hypothetical protein